MGKTDSNPNPSGHDGEGDSKTGQTRKKPRDLSPHDREECGSGVSEFVYSFVTEKVRVRERK